MANVSITVKNQAGEIKSSVREENQAILVAEGEYQEGDSIVFGTDRTEAYYVVRVDDCMDESFVYLTKPEVVYDIPFGEKKISYNPKAFTGERHYLTIREAYDYETEAYRNLARNVMDQHGDRGCFPHAFANVETRGEAVFAARNAIDGVLANESHGAWPYESWGINRQDDAEMTLDFGRPVDFDKIVLYTRADFPHDNWWVKATFTFSDGTSQEVEMEKSVKPHTFAIEKKNITWVKLGSLIKADDPSPFPALTQIEVYGKNS
ncbi:MAG: carbohydrate-binding protein [Lacrimispora sp.]|uniref:DUF7402 domain-containing protein n=1 Tax=Lacrimispora sp. TaxID=2719234 RepID=UPI0039E42FFD